MIRNVALALLMLVASPAWAAASNEFAVPPPNHIFQLQKQNRGHPWLRVTTDSSRLDLRVRSIDALGLAGLRSRSAAPLPPERIAWRSIVRIDEVSTRARQGRIVGFIAGGALGAELANRTWPDQGGLHALGFGLLGGLGAWQGGRLGERMVHERGWYAGERLETSAGAASSDAAGGPAEITRSAGALTLPPVRDTVAISRSPAVLRACERIGRDDLIRMRGDFGKFQGFAAVIGPQGIEGLSASPHRRDLRASPVPAGLVTWNRMWRIEKRGNSAGRGALVGGVLLGGLGLMFGIAVGAAYGGSTEEEVLGAGALGAVIGGGVGAVLGGLIGATIPGWHEVFDGP